MYYFGDPKWEIHKEIHPFFQEESDSSANEYESEEAYQKSPEFQQKEQRYHSIVNLFYSNEDDKTRTRANDCVHTYLMETLPRDVKTSMIAYFMCRPHLERHPTYKQYMFEEDLQEYQIEYLNNINDAYDIFTTHENMLKIEEAYQEYPSRFSASKYDDYYLEAGRIDHIVRTSNDLEYNEAETGFDMDEVKGFVDYSVGFGMALGESSNFRVKTIMSELNDQLVDFYCRAQSESTNTCNNHTPKPQF